MKKYSFLVYHAEYLSFLKDLQDLGVVHIIEKESGSFEDEDLAQKYQEAKKYNDVIQFLKKRNVDEGNAIGGNAEEVLERALSLKNNIEQKNQQITVTNKEIAVIGPWGNFDWETIRKLKENGLEIKFFMAGIKNFREEWLTEYNIEIIDKSGSLIYFVLVQKAGENVELGAEEAILPTRSFNELTRNLDQTKQEIAGLEEQLNKIAATQLNILEQKRDQLSADIDFDNVLLNTQKEAEEKLMVLQGWAPKSKHGDLIKFLDNKGVFYIEEEISATDKVPVLLKNGKFAKLFEPIGELFALPTYKEMDLTPFFAPFYMLFFGFCLGDAGYGLLMVIASIILRFKLNTKAKPILTLVTYLGLSTILFGLIGGIVFGIRLFDTNLPIYSDLAVKFKNNDVDLDKFMFNLSIGIGAIQILFGMFLKAFNEIRMLGFKYALSTFGWLFLFIGGGTYYYLQKQHIFSEEVLKIILYMVFSVSGIFIFILNTPGKNIFLNIGTGIWNTYNMATGILGDLLSYIRLFALGISSAILGFVFNSLAISMRPDVPGLDILVMIIILAIGHGINIFMSGLGSFVHPMRLTFVEFYKNAGFIGGGRKYNPFGKK